MKLAIKAAALALAVILSALPAFAQTGTYPAGPVELVVPFPHGGSSDGLARRIADHLAKKWGQPVLIDNVAGRQRRTELTPERKATWNS